MAAIMHQIVLKSGPDAVFRAFTTQEGLSQWWTSDVTATAEAGSVAVFGFNNHAVAFRMHVAELDPGRRLVWRCESGVAEWDGTKLTFELTQRDDGATVLRFTHDGWRSTEGHFRICNTDWGRLMYYLKDYVEGRGNGPMMS